MHHSSPSAITYPSSPSPTTHLTAPRPTPALLPTSRPYHPPHSPTTRTRPTPHSPTTHLTTLLLHSRSALLHPALLPTSLPHDLYLPYSTQLYYPPHYPTTCTRPTPPIPTTHLTTLLLHTTYPTTRLSIPDPIPYLCAHCTHIYYCDLTGYTYYPAHRTHVPHSTPPCPSPPQMYHATPISYRLYHTALPIAPLSSI